MENKRKSTEKRVAQFEHLLFCLHFTSCFFFQPDKGISVGKLLKYLMSTFIKKGIEKKKSMPRGFVQI
jgi:hypothetical protein